MRKTCTKCGADKPIADFYTQPKTNKCKECYRRDVRLNRERNAAYYLQYDKTRYAADPNRRAKHLLHGRIYRATNPHRKAHVALNNAVRGGRLIRKPCEVCGSVKVEAHHDDYGKPLDVRWLCFRHHRELHGNKHFSRRVRRCASFSAVVCPVPTSESKNDGVEPFRTHTQKLGVSKDQRSIQLK